MTHWSREELLTLTRLEKESIIRLFKARGRAGV